MATDPGVRVRFLALPDCLRSREIVCPKRGPLSLVSTIEDLLERKSSGSSLVKPRLQLQVIRRTDYATPLYP
jgi:hypothetical protein